MTEITATTAMTGVNYTAVLPEIVILVAALAILCLSVFIKDKKNLGYLSLAALVISLVSLVILRNVSGTLFNGFIIIDPFAMFFKAVFLSVSILVVIASFDFIKDDRGKTEYYSLILFATLGMMLVASSGDLITLYVGIELTSISSYALVAFRREDKRSIEAAVKYFIPSAFFSAILLFGISLIYGVTGSTSIMDAPQILNSGLNLMPIAFLGAIFLIAGFGFKMAIVPFQMWAPDTYEGAPTTISAFIAAGSKKMAFAAAFRVMIVLLIALRVEWGAVVAILAVITMTFGNVTALAQKNVKRMLAYSSIAQAGYILVGLAVASKMGYVGQFALASSMLHIMVHAFMKGGAFIAVALISYKLIGETIDDYIGLSKRAPVTAFCMMIFLVSLTGIVPFGGFVSKFFLLLATVKAGGLMVLLAVAVLINSAMSVYYYGRLIKNMYFIPVKDVKRVDEPMAFVVPMVIAVIMLLIIGVYPMPFFGYAMNAAGLLMP